MSVSFRSHWGRGGLVGPARFRPGPSLDRSFGGGLLLALYRPGYGSSAFLPLEDFAPFASLGEFWKVVVTASGQGAPARHGTAS